MRKSIYILWIILLSLSSSDAFVLKKYGNFEFKKANANVYIMHGPAMGPNRDNEGFMNNPSIIEGETSLIIIDPGGNYNVGKKIVAEIEKVSNKPIIAVLNTHKHGDHWFANKSISQKYKDAKIYAHPKMIEEVKAGDAEVWYTILNKLTDNLNGTKEFAYPDYKLVDGQKIKIDSEEFIISHPKTAHTNTDLVIEHVGSKTLFLGDNLMKNRFGNFEVSSSIIGNIKYLQSLKNGKKFKLYVPGHGPSGQINETIDPFLNYLEIISNEAKIAFDDGVEAYEIKPRVITQLKEYQQWDGFENQVGKHIIKAYSEWEEKEMELIF